MLLQRIDWLIVGVYFAVSLAVGLMYSRRAGRSAVEFFAGGRNQVWWLLGVSMVATTFSTDTPNLVTDMVRQHGVSGNWLWWAFLLTGMLTVFVYARLWKRSGVLTDIEFYELRYSGRPAAFLRGFRALYLGFFFNIIIMASVSLAAIKIGGVLLNLTPLQTILLACLITAAYSALSGLLGVLITDFFQFFLAMAGSVAAALVALRLPQVGGLSGLLGNEAVRSRLALLPDFADTPALLAVLVIPLAVQWWSVWYPGAEPGGGGYIAQRMLAARDARHATGAVLFFNAAHYALRPWPWIIVALCSLVVFPSLDSIRAAFPHAAKVGHDMGYPAMLTFLPAGLLGMVVASLIAAYMSTIATHLNWGSSYMVNDFYKRFLRRSAGDKELVLAGRMSTVILMAVAGVTALLMRNALDSFQIMLQVGAGTGLLFILRWFWWRINAWSEIAAMIVSFLVAVYMRFLHRLTGLPPLSDWLQLVIGVGITTCGWLLVTFLTRPTETGVLVSFYRKVRPGGPGWRRFLERAGAGGEGPEGVDAAWQVPRGILCMFLGCVAVYSALFATGNWIYGRTLPAALLTAAAAAAALVLTKMWGRVVRD
ncbi:MAG: Na+:solute symporter [Candidatus Aminicenantes bacterium]|nr:Na+:solute symporter [Candidatus Aminicenantes bacterium]